MLLASGNRSLVREAAEATSSFLYNDASGSKGATAAGAPCGYTEWRMSEILVRHDDYNHSEERADDVCCENTSATRQA